MSQQRITEEEASWIVLARSLSPDLSAAFIAAAEAIAAGRKPEPYRATPLTFSNVR